MNPSGQHEPTVRQPSGSRGVQGDGGEGPAELTRMIGYLTATALEDWTLVLEVCDRASSSESNAKEAIRALRREFKYGEPPAQLAATRLWAIMLHNSSNVFISQSTSRRFLDTLEDLLQSSRTSPVVRERLLEVVAAAAYASGTAKDPQNNRGFKGLWHRVKPFGQPDEGIPFDTDDAMFNPPMSAYVVPIVQDHEGTPPSDVNLPLLTPADTVIRGVLNPDIQPRHQPEIEILNVELISLPSAPAPSSRRPLPLLPGATTTMTITTHQLSPSTGSIPRHNHTGREEPDAGATLMSQHHQGSEDQDHQQGLPLSDYASEISDVDTLPPFELDAAMTPPPPRYSSIFPNIARRLSAWRRSVQEPRVRASGQGL